MIKSGNWPDILTILERDGSLLNYPDPASGNTPVHEAIQCKYTDIVRRLLQLKPELTTKNRNGQTPLQLAAAMGMDEETIDILKKNGKE